MDAAAAAPVSPGSSTVDRSRAATPWGRPSRLPVVDRADAHLVDELEGRRDDARRADRGHGDPGRLERGERADDGALLPAAERPKRQGQLGDDAERSLGADHQRGQVVAGRSLRGAAAEAHDLSVREHHGHAQHVVARHAVLHAADAARIRGGIAADRRDPVARRVGRIPESVSGDRLPEVVVDHPGLGDDVPLCGVDLEHARHALERDDDRVRERVRAAREAGSRPARDDAQSFVGGESHCGGDVIGRLRQNDGERTVVLGPLRVVVRVVVEPRRFGDDLIVSKDLAQRRSDGVGDGSGWISAHEPTLATRPRHGPVVPLSGGVRAPRASARAPSPPSAGAPPSVEVPGSASAPSTGAPSSSVSGALWYSSESVR